MPESTQPQRMPESSRELSIQAINVLTQAIHERFGLRVAMGAEVEYCAFPAGKHRAGKGGGNPLDVSAAAKSSGEPAKYFESVPYISAHYKEKPDNQYEVVLNHEKFIHPLQLAHAINDSKDKIRKLGSARGLDITFAPAIDTGSPNGLTTNALHLNFSLQDGAGDNLLGKDANLTRYLMHRSMEVMQEGIAIMGPVKDSYRRFHGRNSGFEPNRFDHLHGMRIRTTSTPDSLELPETRRLENRFPDADADPFATVAVTLAGIYYALSRTAEIDRVSGAPVPKQDYPAALDRGPIPKTLKEAARSLSDAVILPAVLNELSPANHLGSRFCEAAAAGLEAGGQSAGGGWFRRRS